MFTNSAAFSPALIDEAIPQALLSVLETMFFTSIESSTDVVPQWCEYPMCVQLDFTGPLQGRCQLCLDCEAAAALASTLLCLEPDEVDADHKIQVTGELANMVCGCLLSHIEPNANLTLGCPAAVAGFSPLEDAAHRRTFLLPEGQLTIEFRIDRIEGEPAP